MLRLLTRPRWLVRHGVVIALCVGFFFLSRWQFHRGQESQGTIQNYGYSVEWLLFGGAVCFAWWKLLQDDLHPDRVVTRTSPWRRPAAPGAEPVRAAATTVAEIDPDDAEVVAYNAYLAELARSPVRGYRR